MPPRRKNARRKKGNPHRGTQFMDKLPESLFTNILLRLSIKNLLKCKCVCKGWLKKISDSEFTRLQYSSQIGGGILIETQSPKLFYSYNNIEPNCTADGDLQFESIRFSMNYCIPHWETFEVVNSCHGFVCLLESQEPRDIYICNPILGEYIPIPQSSCSDIGSSSDVLAIGFDNKTNDYKILKMTTVEDEDDDYHAAEIYTIGEQEWRSLGNFPVRSESTVFATSQNSFLHGAQHWLCRNGLGHVGVSIVSFNFEEERFGSLPLPLGIASAGNISSIDDCELEVLQGCLALCVLDSLHDSIDLWTMHDYGVQTSWIKKLVFQNLYGPNIRESYVVGIHPTMFLNDGEILICRERVFGRYNADAKSFMEARAIHSPVACAFTYHPSLVSLKDMSKGGEFVRRVLDANQDSGRSDDSQDSD